MPRLAVLPVARAELDELCDQIALGGVGADGPTRLTIWLKHQYGRVGLDDGVERVTEYFEGDAERICRIKAADPADCNRRGRRASWRLETMKLLAWTILAAAFPLSVHSIETGESEFVFSSDLAKRGFEPFATSSAIGSIFGMTDGESLYLCFSVDQPAEQMQRRQTLIAEVAGQSPDRTVPNIPVVCVLTQ